MVADVRVATTAPGGNSARRVEPELDRINSDVIAARPASTIKPTAVCRRTVGRAADGQCSNKHQT